MTLRDRIEAAPDKLAAARAALEAAERAAAEDESEPARASLARYFIAEATDRIRALREGLG